MKNIYKSLILSIVLISVYLVSSSYKTVEVKPLITENKHKNTSAELIAQKKQLKSFPQFELFTFREGNDQSAKQFSSDAVLLKLDTRLLESMNSLAPAEMTFKFPRNSEEFIELELTRVDVLDKNFKVKSLSSNNKHELPYFRGLHYTGIIKGNENSIASFSVFENSIMAIISANDGNFILGAVKNENKESSLDYIFYNDVNLLEEQKFECKAGDTYNEFYINPKHNNISTDPGRTTDPVKIYFVCDYQMYTDNASNTTNVVNFVSGVFNHVKTLYNNEGIVVNISEIGVYDSPDPYRNYQTSQTPEILYAFGTNTQNDFNGDLAHLLSTRTPVNGGIAWINVLCQSYEPSSQSGRYAFSQIENTYSPYPVFSWTVEVITHETGHNFGSMHTHACVWPVFAGGGIGAIDSCYTSEGGCFTGTRPINNGTIMSYCHINGSINFLLGFGLLPSDTINLRYDQALCLDSALFSSEIPLAFNLLQNYPNPFNPGTYIKYALPEDGFVTIRVFDITGQEVTRLINNKFYNAGVFSAYFDASLYNLASGVYLYRIDVANGGVNKYSEIKKMVLVK